VAPTRQTYLFAETKLLLLSSEDPMFNVFTQRM